MDKCVACQFYDRANSQTQADARGVQWGQCRRSAPHLHPVNQKSFMIEGVWPHVRDDDWCGEWKAARRVESRPLNDFTATGPLTTHPGPFRSTEGTPGSVRPAPGSLMPASRPFSTGAFSGATASPASVSQLNNPGGVTPAAATAMGGLRSTGRGD